MKQIGDTRYSIFESGTLTPSACGVLRDPLRQAERGCFGWRREAVSATVVRRYREEGGDGFYSVLEFIRDKTDLDPTCIQFATPQRTAFTGQLDVQRFRFQRG